MQCFGAVVEASRCCVLGQQVFQIDIDCQQVAHGVCILVAVEAAQHHSAVRRPAGSFGRR